MAPAPGPADPIGNLLVIVELTELRYRIPAAALELWAIDCARRALGVDLPRVPGSLRTELRRCLDTARRWVRAPEDELLADHFAAARARQATLLGDLGTAFGRNRESREHALLHAVRLALECVAGEPAFDELAEVARSVFAMPDRPAEAEAQTRRLLVRAKLMPSGAELLVRLDYAESRGLLPNDAASRAWLDRQRRLLMAENEDSRFAVTLRYMDEVFDAELEAAV